MSVRLNKARREFIIRRVLDAAFSAKIKEAKAKVVKVVPEFRKTLMGKHTEAYDSLPENWTRRDQLASLVVGLDGAIYNVELPEAIRFPVRFTFNTIRRKTGELSVEIVAMRFHSRTSLDEGVYEGLPAAFEAIRPSLEELVALYDERRTMEAEVRAVVSSVTTEKRLYEVWPELVEIVPPTESSARGTALAVNIDELNKKIPLPQEKR